MLLKREDLTRKKKQNFLPLRSTYSFLCFIQKNISGMSCTDSYGSGKGMYRRLSCTLLKEKINKKPTKIPGGKERNRIYSFSTNT